MEKENIEKIMEEYKSEMQKLENSNQEKNFETNKKKLHIERLEEEIKDVDPISEKSLYEEYKKQINEAKKELENFIKETRTPDEIYNENKEKEIKIMDAKNGAIKNLTQANMKIDKEINEAELEHKIIMNKISNFELKYDENHIALNGNEQRELFDKSHKLIDKITDLKEAKTKCEEYLVELKQPSKEVETINSILNGTYDSKLRTATEKDLEVEDKKDNTEKEETKVDAEPVKTDTAKPDKIDLNDIDFTLPKEEPKKSDEEKVTKTEETKTKKEEKNYEQKIKELEESLKDQNISEEDRIINEQLLKTYKERQEKLNSKTEQQENELKNVKTIHINGKESKIYVNKDEEKPINIYYGDNNDVIINEYIKNAFNEEIKDKETEQKKYAEFQYADPNIVAILKNNPEQLQKYADALNGNITKKDFPIKLEYNIRGLSKSEMSDEEKQQIEDYAFIHRNIAKIKKTPFQAIKFAFKGLLEKFRKVKALPAGNLIKEDDDYTMSDEGKEAYEKAYEQSKSFKESLKVEKTEEKINDNTEEKMNRYAEIAKKINESFDKDIENKEIGE